MNDQSDSSPLFEGPEGERERIVERFEEALFRGAGPTIDDFLTQDRQLRQATLSELVHVEFEYRLKADEACRVEEYLGRYPELADDGAFVVDLIAVEFEIRRRSEMDIQPAEFVRRFPKWQDKILALLSARAATPSPQVHATDQPVTEDDCLGAEELALGSAFGDYEILERLGVGGMGVVYKVRQLSLDRILALKVIHAGRVASPDLQQRFRKEAKTAAQLRHPNIVLIHEVGRADGRDYFTMDFIEGRSLDDLSSATPLSSRRAAQYLLEASLAVQFAHEHGIVHRDLKPANILVDRRDQAIVTDFGLAKQIETDSNLTATGQLIGTPSFVPPESILSKDARHTPRGDIFSLGATLYTVLAGRPPFRGETVGATLFQVVEDEPPSLKLLNRDAPWELETICCECLHKDPERRYSTAQELANDLARFLDGRSIHARPATIFERAFKWARRRRALATLIAISTISIFTAAGGLAVHNQRLLREQARVEMSQRETATYLRSMQLQLAYELWKGGSAAAAYETAKDYLTPESSKESEQDFAARFLAHRLEGGAVRWQSHEQGVAFIDISSDRRVVATATKQGEIRVWNTANRQAPAFSQSAPSSLVGIRLCKNRLIALTDDCQLLVWDWRTCRAEVSEQIREKSVAFAACFSPDGSQVALAESEEQPASFWDRPLTLRVYDLSTRKWTLERPLDRRLCRWIVFSPDGERLAADNNGQAVFVDLAQSTWQWSAGERIIAGDFHSRGSLFVGAEADGTIELYDVEAQRLAWTHDVESNGISRIISVGTQKTVAITNDDSVITLWDLRRGVRVGRLPGFRSMIGAITVTDNGESFVAGLGDGSCALVKAQARPDADRLGGIVERTAPISYSADGRWFAVARRDHTVEVWDAKQASRHAPFFDEGGTPTVAHRGAVSALVFSRNGDLLLSAGADGSQALWEVSSGVCRFATAKVGQSPIVAAAFTADMGQVTTVRADGKLSTFSTDNGREIRNLSVPAIPMSTYAFSADGTQLAGGGTDGRIRLWTTYDYREVKLSPATSSAAPLVRIAFDPSSNDLVFSDRSVRVRTWNCSADSNTNSIKEFGNCVGPLAFAADGRRFAYLDRQHVRILDRTTGAESHEIGPLQIKPVDLAWTADGRSLAMIMQNGAVEVWDAEEWRVTRLPESPPRKPMSLEFSRDGRSILLRGANPGVFFPNVRENGYETFLGRYVTADPKINAAGAWLDAAVRPRFQASSEWVKLLAHNLEAIGEKDDVLKLIDVQSRRTVPCNSLSGTTKHGVTAAVLASEQIIVGSLDGSIWLVDRGDEADPEQVYCSGEDRQYAQLLELPGRVGPGPANPLPEFEHAILQLAVDDSQENLAAIRAPRTLIGCRLASREVVTSELPENDNCVSLLWVPDSDHDASSGLWLATTDRRLVLYDLADLKSCWQSSPAAAPAFCCAVDRKTRLAAVGRLDHTIELWSLDERRQVATLRGHAAPIRALAFMPGTSQVLASGSDDRDIRIWDVPTGTTMLRLQEHNGPVTALSFRADGEVLVSGGVSSDGSGEVMFWDAPSPQVASPVQSITAAAFNGERMHFTRETK